MQEMMNILSAMGIAAREKAAVMGETEYLKEWERFLKSYDFMRLGQAVNRGQWEAAMMTARRMEQTAGQLGAAPFVYGLSGIRQAIARRESTPAKQQLTQLVRRRVQLLAYFSQ